MKYLVCLNIYNRTADHQNSQTSNMVEFRKRHNLSVDQFIGLADVLGGDLNTVKAISGSAYGNYLSHIDYKIRHAGFASRGGVENTWNELYTKYGGIHQAAPLEEERLEVMRNLGYIFKKIVSGK